MGAAKLTWPKALHKHTARQSVQHLSGTAAGLATSSALLCSSESMPALV
jgi:hypothetical protein